MITNNMVYYISTNVVNNNINKYITEYDGVSYCILNYDENMLCRDDVVNGIYRSIILSFPEKKLLAFAPIKTLSIDKFKEKNKKLTDIAIHEYIDGRLMQVFYDERILKWQIRSITNNNEIHSTDELLFIEATAGNINNPFDELAILEYFPKNYCYTFCLKTQYSLQSSMYLISIYEIIDNNIIKYIPQYEYEKWSSFSNLNGIICFPTNENIYESYGELNEDILYNYNKQKLVLTNTETGYETTVSTNEYKLFKQSQTVDNLLIYKYLCLQRINKENDYVMKFSSMKNTFYLVKQLYDWLIRTVHCIYIDYFIEKKANYIPTKYKNDIQNIHNMYIHSLNTKEPMLITKHIIKEFYDKKDPYEIMNILNYYE